MRWGWARCAISPQQTVEGALHNESHFTGKDTEAQKNERSCARPLGQSRDQSPGLPESGVCALRDHSALPTALLVGQTGDGARRQEDMEGENGCFLALLYPPPRCCGRQGGGVVAGKESSDLGAPPGATPEPLLDTVSAQPGRGVCDVGGWGRGREVQGELCPIWPWVSGAIQAEVS